MSNLDASPPDAGDGSGSVFFIGLNYTSKDSISRSYPLGANGADNPKAAVPDWLEGQWPPADKVIYQPCYSRNCKCCLCCGPGCYNTSFLDPNMEIPPEAVASTGLTESEIRSLVSDVGNELKGRTCCCWRLGWLGPALPVLWWVDVICKGGIYKRICFNQADEAIQGHIKRHNETFKDKGVRVSLEDETMKVKTVDFDLIIPTTRTLTYFPTWVMAVTTLPTMER